MFKVNDSATIGDWLRVYNFADVVPFIEMAEQYYPNKIDACKDAVSIPGIWPTYTLNKFLEKDKTLELYSQGGICSSTVVAMAPWNVVVLWRMSIRLVGIGKVLV